MSLRELLAEAQGKSEFVIVVVADVRGFSEFSKLHESTDIAMFIKRFYMRMMDDYFSGASFFKTKGDGMLMTFPYSEKNLAEVANYVIDQCFKCLEEFPSICAGDPMINFKTPGNIGFGIARGTACCLFSGEEIIDYSGHLLNLASRLMDLARPSGIVIDGDFLIEIIPESYRDSFPEKQIYIRGISEERSHTVYCLEDYVNISEEYLVPLKGEQWQTIHREFKMDELRTLGGLRIELPSSIKPGSELKVTMIHPKMKNRRPVAGYRTIRPFKDYEYSADTAEPKVVLNLNEAYKYLRGIGVQKNKLIRFKVQFVPEKSTLNMLSR
jgi:class 3 adenylate cyclase